MWFNRKTSDDTISASLMQAIAIENAGAQGCFALTHIPIPALGEDDVLVRVSFAGVNRADMFQRLGTYTAPVGDSPIVGLEISGIIEAVGSNVIGWSVGEPVAALTNGGGYAQYVVVPASQMLAKPARLSLAELATLPEACATAYMALIMEADISQGQRVLIHGGASGVGVIMVQIARATGATVFATASTHEKQAVIASLGATPLAYDSAHFADSARTAMGGNGVDIIIDTLGGAYTAHHLALLNNGGRMVILACLEGAKVEISLGRVLIKHLKISGITLRSRSAGEKSAIMEGVRKHLWPLVAAGHVKPIIDSIFPLSDVTNAHTRMENRLNCGKIVLEVSINTTDAQRSGAAASNNETIS